VFKKGGGYLYLYRSSPKSEIRGILKGIIRKWARMVEERIDEW